MPMLLALQTDNKVTLSLTILLTGLVVVFLVLIVLTEIIKLYGTLVHNATNKNKKPKPVEKAQEPAPAPVSAPVRSRCSRGGRWNSRGNCRCDCRCRVLHGGRFRVRNQIHPSFPLRVPFGLGNGWRDGEHSSFLRDVSATRYGIIVRKDDIFRGGFARLF